MTPQWKRRQESLRLKSLEEMFGVAKPVIGMIHLPPLPGSPNYDGTGIEPVVEWALHDVETYHRGGIDGLIVENMWDHPYFVGEEVPPEEMTAQAVAAREVVKAARVPVGINVIHNGGRVTLSIAVASGASFMRICIFTGARLWDTGELDHGCAARLLRHRKHLHAEGVKIFADVDKKHSLPFPGLDLETHMEWSDYYLADALIVSGRMTGDAPTLDKVRRAKEASRGRPILMGSGTSVENIGEFLRFADGAIVGTALKVDGCGENPVDLARVERYMEAVERVRTQSKVSP
ncbi:MAG: BtpA/SgcQ family protein [Acidobacteriota bacterium]